MFVDLFLFLMSLLGFVVKEFFALFGIFIIVYIVFNIFEGIDRDRRNHKTGKFFYKHKEKLDTFLKGRELNHFNVLALNEKNEEVSVFSVHTMPDPCESYILKESPFFIGRLYVKKDNDKQSYVVFVKEETNNNLYVKIYNEKTNEFDKFYL